jgi:hypothetical protein
MATISVSQIDSSYQTLAGCTNKTIALSCRPGVRSLRRACLFVGTRAAGLASLLARGLPRPQWPRCCMAVLFVVASAASIEIELNKRQHRAHHIAFKTLGRGEVPMGEGAGAATAGTSSPFVARSNPPEESMAAGPRVGEGRVLG